MAQDDDHKVIPKLGAPLMTPPSLAPPRPSRMLETMSRVSPFGQDATAETTSGRFDVTGLAEDVSLDQLAELFGSTPTDVEGLPIDE